MKLRLGGDRLLDLTRTQVMGVVNVTPDSFSDGGQYFSTDEAIEKAYRLVDEGADLIDLGAESTRPGATPIGLSEELARLLPVLRALRDWPVPISVDTYKPEVMEAAAGEGAALINDVYALRMPGAPEAVARSGCAVCLMHMQGDPETMQVAPHYDNVVTEVRAFLEDRVAVACMAGVDRERIVVDPGFGFGKTLEHNIALLRHLRDSVPDGFPVLVGLSRKSLVAKLTGRPIDGRMPGSVGAALRAAANGAHIVRVHDVAATRDALKVFEIGDNSRSNATLDR